MDKAKTKLLWQSLELPTPDFEIIDDSSDLTFKEQESDKNKNLLVKDDYNPKFSKTTNFKHEKLQSQNNENFSQISQLYERRKSKDPPVSTQM